MANRTVKKVGTDRTVDEVGTDRNVGDVGTDRTVEEVDGDDDVKYRSTKIGGANFDYRDVEEV